MNASLFVATTGRGIARAFQTVHGDWRVQYLLTNEDVRCLSISSINPDLIYAGTQGNGVFRSDDGGRSWTRAGMEGQIVKSVAASPLDLNTVYAGTKPAWLFVSHDCGETWTEIESLRNVPGRRFWFTSEERPFSPYVQSIALSPVNSKVISVGIEGGGVLSSSDRGRTWGPQREGAQKDCHILISHHYQDEWLYETGGSGVSFSYNTGLTWQSVDKNKVFDRRYCWGVAAEPFSTDLWYVAAAPNGSKAQGDNAQAYIFRYRRGTWTRLEGGLPQPLRHMPYALITDRTAEGHLYAGLSNGDIWFSDNYGDRWSQIPVNLGSINKVLVMGI